MPNTPSQIPLADAREVMCRAFGVLRSHLATVHEAVRHAHALGGHVDAGVYAALEKERAEVDAAFAVVDGLLWREVGGK
jgi:hypothetical protein